MHVTEIGGTQLVSRIHLTRVEARGWIAEIHRVHMLA